MKTRLSKFLTATFNIYLVFSSNIIQIISADRPVSRRLGRYEEKDGNGSLPSEDGEPIDELDLPVTEFLTRQLRAYGFDKFTQDRASDFSSYYDQSGGVEYDDFGDFSPSKQISGESPAQTYQQRDGPKRSRGERRDNIEFNYIGGNPGVGPFSNNHQSGVYDERRRVANFNNIRRQEEPFRLRYPSAYNPYREEPGVRFPGSRPVPAQFTQEPVYRPEEQYSYPQSSAGSQGSPGGFLSGLVSLVRPKPRPTNPPSIQNEPSYEFIANNQIDTDKVSDDGLFLPQLGDYEDYNINYVEEDNVKDKIPDYDLKDVLYSIKNNESRLLTLKKFLSAASSISDRQDPGFLINTPVTILSILGVFYAVSAIAVVAYKYSLYASGSSNGASLALLPIAIVFIVPLLVVTAYLVVRGSLDGQINLGRLARGDFKNMLRQDFDMVDFAYNAAVGSTALLGLGWTLSVIL